LAVIVQPAALSLAVPQSSCVILDTVQDTGNLGTILRSAAAAGIDEVFLSEGCAQAWSPRVLRAAMGAHFVLTIQEKTDIAALVASFKGQVLATGLQQAKSLYDLDLTQATAWLFGSEGQGLSEPIMALAHQQVIIPMAQGVESLNVAAAAAVCLFEQRRQKLCA
jgi:TrmH family RNA methyltransferase